MGPTPDSCRLSQHFCGSNSRTIDGPKGAGNQGRFRRIQSRILCRSMMDRYNCVQRVADHDRNFLPMIWTIVMKSSTGTSSHFSTPFTAQHLAGRRHGPQRIIDYLQVAGHGRENEWSPDRYLSSTTPNESASLILIGWWLHLWLCAAIHNGTTTCSTIPGNRKKKSE